MKRIAHLLLLILLVGGTFTSCRRTDTFIKIESGLNSAAVDRFLTLPANAGKDLQDIVTDLKKAEARHPFLAAQVAANGTAAWKYTISPRSLFNAIGAQGISSSVPQSGGAPLYFIPLIDSVSNEIKSFIFCAKTGDSSYVYRLYNKNTIEHEKPRSIEALNNGTTYLGVFAVFEKLMHNQGTTKFEHPWSMPYVDPAIHFEDNPTGSTTLNAAKNNSIHGSLKQKVNDACWVLHSQTFYFRYGVSGAYYVMAWREDICSGDIELLGFSRLGGDQGSSSGGSSGGSSSGGSASYGYYGAGGSYWPGNPWGNWGFGGGGDGSSGGGGTGGPQDPFGPPGSINDPTFGYPPPGGDLTPAGLDVFYNQFMTPGEGHDDGDPYDATYWEDPNLTMPAQALPSFSAFQVAYPKHHDPLYDTPLKMYAAVGGDVYSMFRGDPGSFQNTCALRVSRALLYSGITIPPGPNRFKGGDGKYYFLGAKPLIEWLKKTFGTPSGGNHLTGAQGGPNGVNFPGLVAGKKGIFGLLPVNGGASGFGASGHLDLINDQQCDGGCYFNAEGGVLEIFIWELP